jgi:hypothetical protein
MRCRAGIATRQFCSAFSSCSRRSFLGGFRFDLLFREQLDFWIWPQVAHRLMGSPILAACVSCGECGVLARGVLSRGGRPGTRRAGRKGCCPGRNGAGSHLSQATSVKLASRTRYK